MYKTLLSKTMLLLAVLLVGAGNALATPVTKTYTFTSKDWKATDEGGKTANWTSGKTGNAKNDQGVQVTSGYSGANATSPIAYSKVTQIEVTYSTNNKAGAGTIKVKVGSGSGQTFSVSAPSNGGGTTDKTTTFTFSPAESGNVTITGTCTTNSIYIKSISITYDEDGGSGNNNEGDDEDDDGSFSLGKTTYMFTNANWNATSNGENANWESVKAGYTNNSETAVQVTSGKTGANATSPQSFTKIKQIIVAYHQNTGTGAGAIKVQVANNEEKEFAIAPPQNEDGKTIKNAEFNYEATETGTVKITVDCTVNSIYIVSATIITEVEANMTIRAGKYATFIAPYDVDIPSGVTASKVTGTNGATLTLEALATAIPANTPVLLYSDAAVNETFFGVSTATASSYKEGLLTGVYKETAIPIGSYVLQTQKIDAEEVQAFYKVDSELTTVPNRAYLTLENASVKALFFDVETSIEAVGKEAMGHSPVYNLAGQRVGKPGHGLYIINGKKTLLK